MKKTHIKYLVITLLLSSFIIGLSFSAKSIQADDDDDIRAKLDLYYASYGDFDGDGLEDDCYYEAKLYIGSNREFKSYWFLTLELPSGTTFCFTYSCGIESSDGIIDVKIYTFNTAIESGWFIGTLYCKLYNDSGQSIWVYDQIIFDPPTGIDPGDPEGVFQIG
ncbi:MAG: hypothetical protein FK733_16015 [Asgard group archaeon]|nr:hypothetical protein [Asgard group archaeon]